MWQLFTARVLCQLNQLRPGIRFRDFAEEFQQLRKPLLSESAGEAPNRKGSFLLDSGVAAKDMNFPGLCASRLPGDRSRALQSNKINFYDDQVFVKRPKTSERTAYHQDSSYFHFEGDQACTMWIPVDPVSFNSGTIRYVRGSHRWGFFKPNVFVSQMAFPGADGDTFPTSMATRRTTTS